VAGLVVCCRVILFTSVAATQAGYGNVLLGVCGCGSIGGCGIGGNGGRGNSISLLSELLDVYLHSEVTEHILQS